MQKNNHKCRNASPHLLDRLVMWFGFDVDLHCWHEHKKIYGHTIYYCRTCECGADQIQSNGPMGDGKWRDVSAPWKWDWEREQFKNAQPYSSI